MTFGALSVLKHLLPRFLLFLLFAMVILDSLKGSVFLMTSIFRLSEALHNKRPLLVEAVKLLLDEQDLGVRKALSEVVSYELIVLESFFHFLILLVKYSCFLLDSDFFGGS